MLGLTHPLAFGRSTRLQQYVGEMCEEIELEVRWPVEIAAMVSQLGSITLPESVAEKVYYGHELSKPEQELVEEGPQSIQELLGNIPRLEPVMELLLATVARARDVAPKHRQPVGMLKIALDFDVLIARGLSPDDAVATLRSRGKQYPQSLVEALARRQGSQDTDEIRELPISAVRQGMVFAEDVRTEQGILLVARGFEITAGFVLKARGFRPGYVKEPVRVVTRRSEAA